MDHNIHTNRSRDGIHRDVIMGRTNAAGREEIIVAPAQDVHRFHNGLPIVSDDADLLQPDALDIQPKRDLGNIPVLSPARQYLVPDHDRSEEHTSELQSLMRNPYAAFCLKKT